MAKDGGPAFPYSVHMEGYDRITAEGMSLRALLASQALIAEMRLANGSEEVGWQKRIAWRCCSVADAVLAELEKDDG